MVGTMVEGGEWRRICREDGGGASLPKVAE